MGWFSKFMLAAGGAAALVAAGGLALGVSEQTWKDCQQTTNADASIRSCSRIISDYMSSKAELASAHERRAAAYMVKDDHAHAVSDLSEAIRLSPKHTDLIVLRGTAYSAQGSFDKALADFNTALRADPLDARALAGRGQAYERKGDRERARSDYKAALSAPALKTADKKAREVAHEHLSALDKAPSASSPTPPIPEPRQEGRQDSQRPSAPERAQAQPAEPPKMPGECPRRAEDLEAQLNDFFRWVDRIKMEEYAQIRTSSPDPCKIDRNRLTRMQNEIQQQGSALTSSRVEFYQNCTDKEMTKIIDEIKKREPVVDRQSHTVTLYRTSILHGRLEKLSNLQVMASKRSESIVKISSRMKNLSDWAKDVVRDCSF